MSEETSITCSIGIPTNITDRMAPEIVRRIHQAPVSGIEWIARDRLHPNDYNPNSVAPAELDLLKTSIICSGFTQPIVVNRKGMEIVDGYHRWLVSGDLEIQALYGGYVPVVLVHLSPPEKMSATIRHNRARGEHAILKVAEIVSSMKKAGVVDEEIASMLGMGTEEFRRLELTIMDDVDVDADFSKAWVYRAMERLDPKYKTELLKDQRELFTQFRENLGQEAS